MTNVRPATEADAHALADLVNAIIARGGTTAYEEPFTPEILAADLLTGPDVVCCFVAFDDAGVVQGFQALVRDARLPAGIVDIATFSRVGHARRGFGTRLFANTREAAVADGLDAINATIRADNLGGLAFYTRMGFVDHAIDRGVPLRDGTPVDRVHKRYRLCIVDRATPLPRADAG